MQNVDIFSFFSGAGFLDLGFESENYNITFVNEIHAPFLDAYKYARQNMAHSEPEYGYSQDDIVEFTDDKKDHLSKLVEDSRKKGQLVGFIGGPPCPDFSIGGKNKGRKGNTGPLSEAYIELICSQQPDFFLFENVKGLWRTKKHRAFFDEMKSKVHNAGYITTQKLMNSLEFNVPQDRDRIIFLGFNESFVHNYSLRRNLDVAFPWDKYTRRNHDDILQYPWPDVEPFEPNSDKAKPDGIIEELTVEHWFRRNNIDNHPNADHHFQPRAGLPKFLSIEEGDSSRKSYKRLHRWRYSPTAAYGNNEVHLHPYKARRLSAAEALAIQSLPESFILPDSMSLTNMFKTIGNGVPYLFACGLAKTLKSFLESPKYDSAAYSFRPFDFYQIAFPQQILPVSKW